jgi:hypothetical protein
MLEALELAARAGADVRIVSDANSVFIAAMLDKRGLWKVRVGQAGLTH